MSAYLTILDSLRANGHNVIERGDKASAQCPAHDDMAPSLSVGPRRDGKGAVVYCHAGCSHVEVLTAIGLSERDLFDADPMREALAANRDYKYPGGRVKHRRRNGDGKKMWQTGNMADRSLYRAEHLAADTDAAVYLCEGEKAADTLAALGHVAVATGGAKASCDMASLAGRTVIAVVDRDDPGAAWAQRMRTELADVAASVSFVQSRAELAHADVVEHIAAGHDVSELVPVGVDPPAAAEPGDDPDGTHSGQVRMAYRLAHAYADRLLHVHGIGWHFWDGTRWAYDDLGAASRAVLDVLRHALADSLGDTALRADVKRCESHAGVQGILGIAAALTPFAATVRDLDADPYLLNVANGTLDLRTLELSPHRPADRLTKVTRAAWRNDTTDGDWHRFLSTVLPDEPVHAYVQRHIGMALLGRITEHVLSIWTGTGANGKGTTIGALCFALGDYASTAEPDLLLHRQGAHPTGEMDLLGRRLVVMSESDDGRRMAEATMKRLTGGDTIRARRMRQDFIEFAPSHTPILVTNHLPVVSGDDPAVWRRLRVVPFDVVIPENQRDGDLPERLEQAADEVLSWCIAGWTEYQQIGLAEPDAVRARTSEYQTDSDAVARFITERCVTSSSALKVTTGQLFDAWERWRVADGAELMSQKAFGQALDRKGYLAGKPSNGKRWRTGIALVSDRDDADE